MLSNQCLEFLGEDAGARFGEDGTVGEDDGGDTAIAVIEGNDGVNGVLIFVDIDFCVGYFHRLHDLFGTPTVWAPVGGVHCDRSRLFRLRLLCLHGISSI